MNRPHPLLIIINNASLPIYLPRTHATTSTDRPGPASYSPSPITHIIHTWSHIHAHHLHTHAHSQPPIFSHTNTFFECSFPSPPPLTAINLTLFSLPHPLTPSLPPTPQLHPFIAILHWHSYPPPDPSPDLLLLQGDLHCEVQEDKSRREKSGDFLRRQSNGNTEWNKTNHCCCLAAAVFEPPDQKFQEQVTWSTSRI